LKQTDLADKILELLAQNSQKLEKLESELAQFRIDNSGITASEITPNNSRNDLLKFLPEKMAFYFDLGSSRLSSVAILQLNELVEILAKSTHIHVVITGFADQTGNDSMNLALSKKRAQVVKNFLKQSGMSESRFIINYYGESKSISKSNQDRRVEIKFFID
jgi:outer membrane protein OmpA-like peptidoglycan-associated protein